VTMNCRLVPFQRRQREIVCVQSLPAADDATLDTEYLVDHAYALSHPSGAAVVSQDTYGRCHFLASVLRQSPCLRMRHDDAATDTVGIPT
jgi:hypothetical protein